MRRCLRHCAVLLAVVMLTGGHWNVLQGVAWATMLLSRSLSGDVASAVSTTFDGAHPCALCAVVDDGKAAEGDDEGVPDDVAKITKKTVKKDALPSNALLVTTPRGDLMRRARIRATSDSGRRDAPPVPPPRST